MNSEFFLGANSACGFSSLYEEFLREKAGFFYLIKGGAGGGKSGFMKKIAERAENLGYDTEIIRCSGDPDSLDAVYITKLSLGFIDATSPHALEPEVFALNSCYVNLGRFCKEVADSAAAVFSQKYKAMYRIAYSYLSAANSIKSTDIPDLFGQSVINKVKSRARNTALREFGKVGTKTGTGSHRYIRCISCKGELCLIDTVEKLCKHIYLLDDRFGLEQYYLDAVTVSSSGENVIICPSPLDSSRTDALLFPDRSVAFVSASLMQKAAAYRHVRLDALVSSEALREHRAEIRRREKQYAELIESAVFYLGRAKHYHDLLEQVYRPYIDFEALSEFTERELDRIFE